MTARTTVLVTVLVALVLGAVGVVTLTGTDEGASTASVADTRAPSPPPAAAGTAGADVVVPGRGSLAAAGQVDPPPAAPTVVRIPRIEVATPLEDLRTDRSGRLRSPQEWQSAGWFADGTTPGQVGPAVIAGHVDSPTGPAVFARLDELEPGDLVSVERADGTTVDFEVDRAETVPQDAFPTAAVYGPTPDAQLRLITCDGPYLRSSGGYQDNLVVWASAVAR